MYPVTQGSTNLRTCMILDPYIIRAGAAIDAARMLAALRRLYPDAGVDDAGDTELIDAWLKKFKRKPGLALSTGRTKSDKGMLTCCMLDALAVDRPKAARARMQVAWAILNSHEGQRLAASAELDVERAKWFSDQPVVVHTQAVGSSPAADELLAGKAPEQGARVWHEKFGGGEVVKVEGRFGSAWRVTVKWDSGREVLLQSPHPALRYEAD